jgi:hypothetical protein
MELFRYAYDENFAEGILNCFSHRTRYAIYCKKNGLSTERRRTITHNISISEAENAVQNVTEGYIDYNYELDALLEQANLNNYDEDLTKKIDSYLQEINPDYKAKRKNDMLLKMPIIHIVKK